MEKVRREKIRDGESRETTAVFFQCFVTRRGSKVRLAKAAGAEVAGQRKMKNCTPMWREAHLEAKCAKHTMFGPLSEVEMWKSIHRCGAKHIWKQKCAKHTMFGPLSEVEISKK